MAIGQLTSTNPHFSFIISKNPTSGMIVKSLRKGKTFGWYSDEQTFNVFFKDADNEVSYQQQKDQEFEYLNTTRYNSPIFPLNMLTDYFSSTLKGKHEYDTDGFEHRYFINLVHVEHRRYLEFFDKHFSDYTLHYEEVAYKNYQITIQTTKSIHELLHFCNTFFLFLTLICDHYLEIANENIEKYIKSINIIEAPFYIRYLFVRNVLTSKDKFFKYKSELENYTNHSIQFAFGNTAIQRREWIQHQLPFDKPIVDIGCGEGAYAIPFSKKISDLMYHAIDLDGEVRQKLHHKLKVKQIENVAVYESLADYLDVVDNADGLVDVLLTEVVEHMPLNDATSFVEWTMETVPFNQLIITTPNQEFNTFYALDGMRHHDHKWEMTSNEFTQWMVSLVDASKYNLSFFGIGDNVNNITTTQAAIITRKDV